MKGNSELKVKYLHILLLHKIYIQRVQLLILQKVHENLKPIKEQMELILTFLVVIYLNPYFYLDLMQIIICYLSFILKLIHQYLCYLSIFVYYFDYL